MRLRAWQMCWIALDAASAPANHLPDSADTQGWPPALIEQLRATPGLPKLNTRTWQELRRARDQHLFATVPPQASTAAEPFANEALAALLTDGFALLGLEQLRAWITPSVTAAIARWLSAALLAIDALALSDDNSDATALELVAFVQATLEREHGAAAAAADLVQSEPALPAAVDKRVPEAQREDDRAAALAPQPAADPAPAAIAAQLDVAVPSAPNYIGAVEQPARASTRDAARADARETATRTRRPRLRPTALVASAVAVAVASAALLLLMLRTEAAPSTSEKPPVSTPAPSAHVVTPKPQVAEPAPVAPVTEATHAPQASIEQPTATAPRRPRFRNLAAAKRAHSAKKIDEVAYAAAIAELEALRTSRIAKEQLNLRSGKLSQAAYQRRVDAINRNLGFERR